MQRVRQRERRRVRHDHGLDLQTGIAVALGVAQAQVVEAQHAMPDEGAVEISTMTSRSDTVQSVRLSIRDNGKGVRADAKERIFDPYFQSRPGNKNPGFSLAMVYQFVASSGGSIEVESASGKGVAYLLSFPAADHAACLP